MKKFEDHLVFEENEGIYSKDFREGLLDDGEISAWEEAFMSGWDEAG